MNWYKIAQTSNELKQLETALEAKYPGLDLYIWENKDKIEIAQIRLPKNLQGKGIGSSVIREIQQYAQKIGKVIVLMPAPESRKKKALDNFYKNLGFIANKGRHKDWQLSSFFGPTMYWKPNKTDKVD